MAFSECENGHIYDTSQYTSCPYCKNKEVRIEFGTSADTIGKTVPVSVGSDIGKTVPVSAGSNIGKTVPVSVGSNIGKTVPVSTGSDIGKTVPVSTGSDIDRTVTASSKVYGWLVSTDGKDCGMDYKITSANCVVGTGSDADISLSGVDSDYSGIMFRICFDKRGGQFYIVPDQGYTDIYIAGEPVFTQRLIPTGTVLEIGKGKYIFVALCNDNFKWD